MMNDFFLTDAQVAGFLSISIETLRNKIVAGDPLPPFRQIPNCRARIWLADEFRKWLMEQPITKSVASTQAIKKREKY